MNKISFTIRDLLWLTVVVAFATGWWLDHRRLTTPPTYLSLGGLDFKPPGPYFRLSRDPPSTQP